MILQTPGFSPTQNIDTARPTEAALDLAAEPAQQPVGESIHAALWSVETEARRRLDGLIGTLETLIDHAADDRIPEIRGDLDRIGHALSSLEENSGRYFHV